MKRALKFCSCKDTKCPRHPVNHDFGCDLCVAHCLRKKDVPSCFFHAAGTTDETTEYTFAGFSDFLAKQSNPK